jgi:hypothetical protein
MGDGHIFPLVVFLSASRKQSTQKESGFHDARLTPYQKRTLLVSASSAFTQMQVKDLRQFYKSDEPPGFVSYQSERTIFISGSWARNGVAHWDAVQIVDDWFIYGLQS